MEWVFRRCEAEWAGAGEGSRGKGFGSCLWPTGLSSDVFKELISVSFLQSAGRHAEPWASPMSWARFGPRVQHSGGGPEVERRVLPEDKRSRARAGQAA